MSLAAFAGQLQASSFGQWAGGGAYPVANTLHLLGLVMLVGGIGIVDLRIAGFFRALPVEALSRALTPVALAGLAIMVPTGFTLFAADARTLAESPVFQWKLALIILALGNALLFRWVWRGELAGWTERIPALARTTAAGSLLLWLAVGTLGRMIAYS